MSTVPPPAAIEVHRDGETVLTEIELEPRPVHVRSGLTPLDARLANLLRVTTALQRAGIEHFAVRGLEDRASVVGVLETDRDRVITALGRALENPQGFVRSLVPQGVGRNPVLPGNRRATWTQLRSAKVLRCFAYQADPSLSLIHGIDYGCDVEFWTEGPDGHVAPRANRCTRLLRRLDATMVDGNAFTRLAGPHVLSGQSVATVTDFDVRLPEDIDFPIDLVYTWVDGTDPSWAAKKASSLGQSYHAESSSAARYLSRNELLFSVRSVRLFAPWVRHIYVVTDDQQPSWLDETADGISVVSHREIFSDPSWLPTYNSHAIESQLHHIDGLSEHFLYLNDDMFFGRPVTPNAFFLSNGLAKYFPSQSRVPLGEITSDDTPVDAACKNNRELLKARFGPVIVQSMQHVPYALRRSVLQEIETEYPEAYARTASSPVRSPADHSFTSSLHQYYSYLSGRGLAGNVRYTYIQLAVEDLPARLARLLERRDRDTFCLNDAFSTADQLEAQTELLSPFFHRYFPVASPFEREADA